VLIWKRRTKKLAKTVLALILGRDKERVPLYTLGASDGTENLLLFDT
jgi:hypothetical protein